VILRVHFTNSAIYNHEFNKIDVGLDELANISPCSSFVLKKDSSISTEQR
jgi:hypothetical protein